MRSWSNCWITQLFSCSFCLPWILFKKNSEVTPTYSHHTSHQWTMDKRRSNWTKRVTEQVWDIGDHMILLWRCSVCKSDLPGGLFPFLEKCCCRQNESLLSKQHPWPIRKHFSHRCCRGNVSSHFNYSLNLGFNCHKCLVPWFCILFTYQTSTAVIPVSLLSPKPGAGFLQHI